MGGVGTIKGVNRGPSPRQPADFGLRSDECRTFVPRARAVDPEERSYRMNSGLTRKISHKCTKMQTNAQKCAQMHKNAHKCTKRQTYVKNNRHSTSFYMWRQVSNCVLLLLVSPSRCGPNVSVIAYVGKNVDDHCRCGAIHEIGHLPSDASSASKFPLLWVAPGTRHQSEPRQPSSIGFPPDDH
jgi:hypothetical protein